MLPIPRTGSRWMAPNSRPCTPTASQALILLNSPRSISPRKIISSTIGAAMTAVTSSVMTYVRSRSRSPIPSVLLVNGTSSNVTRIATTAWAKNALSHTSGPQPRSDQRKRRPRSVRRSPLPHRPAAYRHHHTDGP